MQFPACKDGSARVSGVIMRPCAVLDMEPSNDSRGSSTLISIAEGSLTLGPMPGSVQSASTASAYGTLRSACSQAAPPPGFALSSATLPVTNLALPHSRHGALQIERSTRRPAAVTARYLANASTVEL